jgi:hypothetical protein
VHDAPVNRHRPGWLEALAIGVASRAFSIVVLWLPWAIGLPAWGHPQPGSPFTIWDGDWYVFIARYGYHAEAVVKTQYGPGYHDFAFFPAWPMLLKGLSLDGRLPPEVVGPVAANVLFLVATITIFSILERVGGRSIARWGLALFAFSPAAFAFSLIYTEPLFIVIAAWFFVAAEKRWAVRSAILAAAAQLVRVMGAGLAFASLPDLLRRETRLQAILVIGATIGAFAAWWTWIAVLTGDPMGYLLGTPSWWLNQRPTPIPVGLGSFFDRDQWTDVIAAGLIVAVTLGARWLWRRGERRLTLYVFATLASCMLDTQTVMPRLLAIAFPAYGGLAAIAGSARRRWLLLAAFALSQAVFGAFVVRRLIVP